MKGIMFALAILLLSVSIIYADTGTGGAFTAVSLEVSDSWGDRGAGSSALYTASVSTANVWADSGVGGVYSVTGGAFTAMYPPSITSCTVLTNNTQTHSPATMAIVMDTGDWPVVWLNELYLRMLANGTQVTEANTWTDGSVYLSWSPTAAFSGNYSINCTMSGHGLTLTQAAGYINVTNVYPTVTNCTTDPHAVNTGEWVEAISTLVLGTWWSSDIGSLWLKANNITVAEADTKIAGENHITWVATEPGTFALQCGLTGSYVNYTTYYNDSTVVVTGIGTWNVSAWNLSLAAAPITGKCMNDTIPNVLMLFFIAIFIFAVLLLNMFVFRFPVLNLIPAAGLLIFGFTLFYCAWYLGFMCWLLAVGIILMTWSEGRGS